MPTAEQKERLRKLVEALKSGEFVQHKGSLRFGDKFCCLGVACEISGHYYMYQDGSLPNTVKTYYGFDNVTGFQVPQKDMTNDNLAGLNDSGFTFNQIADLIEWEYAL